MNPSIRPVSVLMPVRQVDPAFRLALASLADQTWRDFTLVVVAPVTAHAEIAALTGALALHDLVLVPDPRSGLASALNAGLEACRSPLVARMDADDECAPSRLQRQVDTFASDPGLSVLGTAATLIDVEGRATGHRGPPSDTQVGIAGLAFDNPLVHPSVMFRRDIVAQAGGYAAKAIAEDYDLWLRLAARQARLAILAEPLLRYRIHSAQLSFEAAGYKRCRQIASTLRTHVVPKRPVLGALGWLAWMARGARLALLAKAAGRARS